MIKYHTSLQNPYIDHRDTGKKKKTNSTEQHGVSRGHKEILNASVIVVM